MVKDLQDELSDLAKRHEELTAKYDALCVTCEELEKKAEICCEELPANCEVIEMTNTSAPAEENDLANCTGKEDTYAIKLVLCRGFVGGQKIEDH